MANLVLCTNGQKKECKTLKTWLIYFYKPSLKKIAYLCCIMTKKNFHKIMSISMAFVVLFSTLSFTIDMHFCGDNLVETTIFKKAKGCGMEMQSPSTKDCSITKKNCCTDKQVIIDAQDELKLNFDTLSYKQQKFVASFFYAYINIFEDLEENTTSFSEYPPPLIVRNIYKLDETYLI